MPSDKDNGAVNLAADPSFFPNEMSVISRRVNSTITYNLDIFQAERHTTGSTFRITTSIILVAKPPDTEPPTIEVENFTAKCNISGGGYDGSIPQATVTDNVEVANLTNNAPSTFSFGQTTVTWTATDTSGNSATADQLISVVDTTDPAISPPADAPLTANTAGGFSGDIGTATASDSTACTALIQAF